MKERAKRGENAIKALKTMKNYKNLSTRVKAQYNISYLYYNDVLIARHEKNESMRVRVPQLTPEIVGLISLINPKIKLIDGKLYIGDVEWDGNWIDLL